MGALRTFFFFLIFSNKKKLILDNGTRDQISKINIDKFHIILNKSIEVNYTFSTILKYRLNIIKGLLSSRF